MAVIHLNFIKSMLFPVK